LLDAGRYDGAVYIVGYAVEYKLKARIATTLLGCRAFPETIDEFNSLAKLKVHNLEDLAKAAGKHPMIIKSHKGKWDFFRNNWSPEARYRRIGSANRASAMAMIQVVEQLMSVI
jgi:hypothetical protein